MAPEDDVVKLIRAAQRLHETLSRYVERYPTEWDGVLAILDSMLGTIPEPLRPVGMLTLREEISGRKIAAERTASSAEAFDWNAAYRALRQLAKAKRVASGKTPRAARPEAVSVQPQTHGVKNAMMAYLREHATGREIDVSELYRHLGSEGFNAQSASALVSMGKKNGTLAGSKGKVRFVYQGTQRPRVSQPPGPAASAQPPATSGYGRATRKGSIADRLLAYVNGMDGEMPYATIEAAFSGVDVNTVRGTLSRLKRQGVIEGERGAARRIVKKPAGLTGASGQQAGNGAARIRQGSLPDRILQYVSGLEVETTYAEIGLQFTESSRAVYDILEGLKRQGLIEGGYRSAKRKTAGGRTGDGASPSDELDAVVEYVGRLLERVQPHQADRLEGYFARVAPPETVTAEQARLMHEIGRALERHLGRGGDAEEFLGGLEAANPADDSGVRRYLTSLNDGASSQTDGSGQPDLERHEYWGPRILGNSRAAEMLKTNLSYIAETCPRALDSLAALQPANPHSDRDTFVLYTARQFGQFLQKVEETYGRIDAGIYEGLLRLLNHSSSRYLSAFLAAATRGDGIPPDRAVRMLGEIKNQKHSEVGKIFSGYGIMVV